MLSAWLREAVSLVYLFHGGRDRSEGDSRCRVATAELKWDARNGLPLRQICRAEQGDIGQSRESVRTHMAVHKVFVSYHHDNDQWDREQFEALFSDYYRVFITKSVQIGDIDPNIDVDTVRRKIREDYLGDSSVTVVLVGKETWQRKHVDWEIGASIRHTKLNPRSGVIGIFLPDHPDFGRQQYDPYVIPPRLHQNADCGFATLHHWSNDPRSVAAWIEAAFRRRFQLNPDNSYPSFQQNRSGARWYE